MSESLRDRVARVLYEVATAGFAEVPSFDDAHEFDKADHYVATDALIAAGLVVEGEWEYSVRWKSDPRMRRRTYRPGPWQEAPREAL